MSPAGSAEGEPDVTPLRLNYSAELEQLRLQVELMGVRVDENLERMRTLLHHPEESLATTALRADDDIDAMNVSLTERCYQVLLRETPVASDLRLVLAVVRVTGELERIGDLALRVVKVWPDIEIMRTHERSFDILTVMADEAAERYRSALRAWSAQDLDLATELATARWSMGMLTEALVESLVGDHGPEVVTCALRFTTAGQALDRIADHASLIGVRVRYLLTGDPSHLAAEVR